GPQVQPAATRATGRCSTADFPDVRGAFRMPFLHAASDDALRSRWYCLASRSLAALLTDPGSADGTAGPWPEPAAAKHGEGDAEELGDVVDVGALASPGDGEFDPTERFSWAPSAPIATTAAEVVRAPHSRRRLRTRDPARIPSAARTPR